MMLDMTNTRASTDGATDGMTAATLDRSCDPTGAFIRARLPESTRAAYVAAYNTSYRKAVR